MFDSARSMIASFTNTFANQNDAAAEQRPTEQPDNCLQEPVTETHETLPGKLDIAKQWSTYFVKKVLEKGQDGSRAVAKKVLEATQMDKLTEVVHKVPYWREFNERQEAFKTERSQNLGVHMADAALVTADGEVSPGVELLPPWHPDVSGLSDPAAVETLKSKILALSDHKKSFLVAAPKRAAQLTTDTSSGSETGDRAVQIDLAFRPIGPLDYSADLQLAYSLLQADRKLADMRYRLVPSRISEVEFWHNYLYRVSVLRESAQLSAMAGVSPSSSDSSQDFVCVDAVLESSDQRSSAEPATKLRQSEGGSARAKSTRQKQQETVTAANSGRPVVGANAAAGKKADHELTVEEQLEAELGREVDELLLQKDQNASQLSTASPGRSADDELDAALEYELSELSTDEYKGKPTK